MHEEEDPTIQGSWVPMSELESTKCSLLGVTDTSRRIPKAEALNPKPLKPKNQEPEHVATGRGAGFGFGLRFRVWGVGFGFDTAFTLYPSSSSKAEKPE